MRSTQSLFKEVPTVDAEQMRFNNIMNSRKIEVGASDAGKVIRLKIVGEPKLGWYDERIDALKDIYSFNANKSDVLDSQWFADGYANAIALEAAGDIEGARDAFNELLNASQLSVGIINRSGTKQQFGNGQIVEVYLQTAKVEEKDASGNPTGKTRNAVIVDSISAVQADVARTARRFGAPVVEEQPAPAPVIEAPAATMAKVTKTTKK